MRRSRSTPRRLPFPGINGTARNNREDNEDLNGNTRLDTDDGYFTTTIDLAETEALVDVVYDYDDVQDLIGERIAWRKYRIPLSGVEPVSERHRPRANLEAITHMRIWFEDDSSRGGAAAPRCTCSCRSSVSWAAAGSARASAASTTRACSARPNCCRTRSSSWAR